MLSLTIICLAIGVLTVVGSWITACAMIAGATAPSTRPVTTPMGSDRTLVSSGASV